MKLIESYKWYKSHFKNELRLQQLTKLIDIIKNEFHFQKVICIETGASHNKDDGCVGLFFAKLCELTKGEFHSVDIDEYVINQSKNLYSSLNFKINHYLQDSVKYLNNTPVVPNLIHLDSWDLNLTNPLPSALHGWREFTAIEDKMPIGSIIVIDDNFFKGTWIDWMNVENGELMKKIVIDYPIIGKGSLIYHFVEGGNSNWEKLSLDKAGPNVKLIYKKVK